MRACYVQPVAVNKKGDLNMDRDNIEAQGKERGSLVINETPIFLLPSLAKQVGVNEALFLQLVHTLATPGTPADLTRELDGLTFVKLPLAALVRNDGPLRFLDLQTLTAAVSTLEKDGYIYAESANHTHWFAINYDALGQ